MAPSLPTAAAKKSPRTRLVRPPSAPVPAPSSVSPPSPSPASDLWLQPVQSPPRPSRGAALTGAAIGAAAGGVVGLLKDHGVSDEDADYYENSINNGGVFVSADVTDGTFDRQTAEDILYSSGGHSSARAKSEVAM